MRSKFLQAAVLFVYGGFYEFLVWRIFVRWDYGNTHNSFADHPLTNTSVAVFGGLSVCIFMMLMIRRVRRPIASRSFIFRGMLFGLIATVVGFQAFLLAISFYLGGLWFFLAFIDVETYGLILLSFSMPFGLVCWVLAGAAIAFFSGAPAIERTS